MKLSSISDGTATWELPVSRQLADGLQRVLLAEAPERADRLCQVLMGNPEFALWLLVTPLGRQVAKKPCSINSFARRVAPHLCPCLRACDLAAAAKPIPTRWQALRQLNPTPVDLSPDDPDALLMLLFHAEAWLEACGPHVDQPDALLPAWFLDRRKQYPAAKDSPAAGTSVPDELAGSSQAYPPLAELLEKVHRLEQLESRFDQTLEEAKLAAMKELAYGASHEINNPLANISTRAQTLLRDEVDPERRKKLASINSQAFRAHEMISNMMHFAKPPDLAYQESDLVAILSTVVDELQADAELQGTSLVTRFPESLPAMVDPTHLAKSVKALVINGLEATERGGQVAVTLSPAHSETGVPGIQIQVNDSGPGIPEDVRPHIFDPFYSGREAGRGLGFGLSKCWQVVRQHAGAMDVVGTAGDTTFTIWFPAQPASAARSLEPSI